MPIFLFPPLPLPPLPPPCSEGWICGPTHARPVFILPLSCVPVSWEAFKGTNSNSTVASHSGSRSCCFGINHHRVTKSGFDGCVVLKIQSWSDFLIDLTHLRGLSSTFVSIIIISLKCVETRLKLSKTTLNSYAMKNKTLVQVIHSLFRYINHRWDIYIYVGLGIGSYCVDN